MKVKLDSDLIIKPNNGNSTCIDPLIKEEFRNHYNLKNAEYSGKIQSISFE